MKKHQKDAEGKWTLFLSYGALLGLGIWRAMRPRRKSVAAAHEAELQTFIPHEKLPGVLPKPPAEELESLAPATPGAAPLDALARIAAREEQPDPLITAGGGRAHLDTPEPAGPPHAWKHDDPVVAEVLQHQSLESTRLQGWSLPGPERLPVPTFAPAVMAFGIVIFAMGLATIWYVCVTGAVVFALAAWRWTGELQGA